MIYCWRRQWMAKATSLSSGVIETTSKCIILAFVFKCTVSSERPFNCSWKNDFWIYFYFYTSVNTEMCCPKGQCGCQYFILLRFKKKIMDKGVLDFFNKKLILDFYFCLMSGPVFLFQIFIIRCQCVLNWSSNQDAHYSCPR